MKLWWFVVMLFAPLTLCGSSHAQNGHQANYVKSGAKLAAGFSGELSITSREIRRMGGRLPIALVHGHSDADLVDHDRLDRILPMVRLSFSARGLIRNGGNRGRSESVRAELVRLNRQTGLTLAFYENYLQIVTFKNRGKYEGKTLVRNQAGSDGAVSPDGTQIALLIEHLGQHRPPDLGIVRPDGSDIREYPEVSPVQMCWSHDESKMAMTVFDKPPKVSLVILDLGSKLTHVVLPQVEVARISSQCWSPDDKQIVYEFEGNVRVQEIGKIESKVLAKGTEPTWSPDGNWIAFRDQDTNYAIHPDGQVRKKLFHKRDAVSGLFWSPDSRIVAYVSIAGILEGGFSLDVETNRLRVRRLEDNSEDWVADAVGAGVGYQWVTNPDLLKLVESQAAK